MGSEGSELLTDTTRFTNSQNAVGEKDFIALEKDFQHWAPAFNSKYGIFLEIQRGAWEARKAYQKQHPSIIPNYKESANAFELLKVYAAGWLIEPGVAFGKNPPFAPGGTLFNKIVTEEGFGVDSLYAAFCINVLANGYGFGRAAKQATRGSTRYLFIMVCVDLVKDFLVNNNLPFRNADIVKAIIRLESLGFISEFGDSALQLIDDYLTSGNDECLFKEPGYLKILDSNAFLKSERLGKVEEYCPNLKIQMSMARKMLRKTAPIQNMKSALLSDNDG